MFDNSILYLFGFVPLNSTGSMYPTLPQYAIDPALTNVIKKDRAYSDFPKRWSSSTLLPQFANHAIDHIQEAGYNEKCK